jgi:hypothetical protein
MRDGDKTKKKRVRRRFLSSVSATLARFLLAMRGLASEILLCSRDGDDEKARESQRRAAAEALDIKHAIAFTSHCLAVRAG